MSRPIIDAAQEGVLAIAYNGQGSACSRAIPCTLAGLVNIKARVGGTDSSVEAA